MDIASITSLLVWVGSLLAQLALYLGGALAVVVVGLVLLYLLRAVLRIVRPYQEPGFGQYRGFRYWLENSL